MRSMETLRRKTINFDPEDGRMVAPFLDEGTEEHAALEELVGQSLASDSAELRALVLLGIRHVRGRLLENDYNTAVDAGDFAGTREWVEAARSRRRPRD